MVVTSEQIANLQKHLVLVRSSIGWSAEELGNRIGLKRQTINNLERGKDKKGIEMGKSHYILIRSELRDAIEESKEGTEMLKVVLDAFIDNREKYTDEDRKRIEKSVMDLAPSILHKTPEKNKEITKNAFLIGLGIITIAAVAAMFPLILGSTKIKKPF